MRLRDFANALRHAGARARSLRRIGVSLIAAAIAAAPHEVATTAYGASRSSRPPSSLRRGDIAASIDGPASLACQGDRPPLPDVLYSDLRAGAFSGSPRPDVAVHVPHGFDATRRPGVVIYFHGWWTCIESALSAVDVPCLDGGQPRTAADLTAVMDEARVNAILVAVELRRDMPTGEPGRLAMPGGLRDLLRELFSGPLAAALGCALDVDALDRAIVVAHSGGYQAAAAALDLGDVPRITEVDLLDALYGGDDSFLRWLSSEAARFDARSSGSLRFVDLYTCCGGTADRSRAMAERSRDVLARAGLSRAFSDAGITDGAVVFKEVTEPHGDLPRTYLRDLVLAAGFAPLPVEAPSQGSH
jgi:hypothetical protein